MSTTQVRGDSTAARRGAEGDLQLEVVVIPVTDVDRAKEFYARAGWTLDADLAREDFRLVQFTPPGSACSVQFGSGVTSAVPGSSRSMYLVVSDIAAARADLVERGLEVSEVFHEGAPGARFKTNGRLGGPAGNRQTYSSFASFGDPDGNTWLLQEVTARLPGRAAVGGTMYASAQDLADAMRRASAAHSEHEQRQGGADDENWPAWYAAYMVAEQAGADLPL